MMAMAFDVAYGAVGEIQYGGPVAPPTREPGAMGEVAMSRPQASPPEFRINCLGYALGPAGDRIMPKDVVGRLYDERGETGDLGAIIWADGSTGVLGLTLDISPA
jgi:hypothetical protein